MENSGQRILVKNNAQDNVKVMKFFDAWLKEFHHHMPTQWQGLVIGDSGDFNNTGAQKTIESSLHYVEGRFIGNPENFKNDDNIEAQIVGVIPAGDKANYHRNERMIFEGSAKRATQIVELNPHPEHNLSDARWIQSVFSSAHVARMARIWGAIHLRYPKQDYPENVRHALKNEMNIITSVIFYPSSHTQELRKVARDFLSVSNNNVWTSLINTLNPADKSPAFYEKFYKAIVDFYYTPSSNPDDYVSGRILPIGMRYLKCFNDFGRVSEKIVEDFLEGKPSIEQITQFRNYRYHYMSSIKRMWQHALTMARSAREYINVIEPLINPTSYFVNELATVLGASFHQFRSYRPTLDEVIALRDSQLKLQEIEMDNGTKHFSTIMELVLSLAHNSNDFIRIITMPQKMNISPAKEAVLSMIISKKASELAKIKAEKSDVQSVFTFLRSDSDRDSFSTNLLNNALTAEDFVLYWNTLFTMGYRFLIFQHTIDHFLYLRPNSDQIHAVVKNIPPSVLRNQLHTALISTISDSKSITTALSYLYSQHESWKDSHHTALCKKLISRLLKSNPNLTEMLSVLRAKPSGPGEALSLARLAMPLVRTPQDFLDIALSLPRNNKLERIQSEGFIRGSLDTFYRTEPNLDYESQLMAAYPKLRRKLLRSNEDLTCQSNLECNPTFQRSTEQSN